MNTTTAATKMNDTTPAKILGEFRPLDEGRIHGVTFDGKLVWFARDDELNAFDPATQKVVRRLDVPGACAGTAFDGTNLYQLTSEEILVLRPSDGTILRRMPSPAKGESSGMAYSDGCLWVGQYANARIHKLDAKTGERLKTLSSNRFVTGVSVVGGDLWHACMGDEQRPELRKLASDGTVLESYPVEVERISGVEGQGDGSFWCGGENGTLRRVGCH